ncbi:MAG: ferredoxin family protein [Myxococcales bacterium]|nr:ferredoxin family protein [Myxococcales bacterium]
MTYVITRLCIDCVDRGCVEVCPVECIYEPLHAAPPERPAMLYIHPTQCISCGACEPECPWGAIYEDRELPDLLQADAAINVLCEEHPSAFAVAVPVRDATGQIIRKSRPSVPAVAANRSRWGVK